MPRIKSKKSTSNEKPIGIGAALRSELNKQSKASLVDLFMEIALDDLKIWRQLEQRFAPETPPSELLTATRLAISDATDCDEREINRNFDYDYAAYQTVKRNFQRLIELGQLNEVVELAIDLMKQGSHQVEMSDEGLMTDDIAACLRVVIQAVSMSKLPAPQVAKWRDAMLKTDRVGFICDKELRAL